MKFLKIVSSVGCIALCAQPACTDGSRAGSTANAAGSGGAPTANGGSMSAASGAAASATTGGASSVAGSAPSGAGAGGVDSPGTQPSSCESAAPAPEFRLASGDTLTLPGPYVLLAGSLPPNISGSPVTSVTVNGATRGVRMDAEHKLWSFFLAAPSGEVSVVAKSASGQTQALTAHVTVGNLALPERDIADEQRLVGTWMFSWFSGDPSWQCSSAWRPIGGFKSWDGSVAWARNQLLDQIDAHLDAVGLQLDTTTGSGPEGYRFTNIVHVVEAARQLLEEGVAPPRLFPFLDTAIISDHYGSFPDLSTEAGRAYLYGHAQAYYKAANMALGSVYGAAGTARFKAGLPAVAFWHSETMTGLDNAAVLDFKARFQNDFGSSCYFIAHPNNWRNYPAVDEITQMLGPPTHFAKSGHDAAAHPTVNLEAGFWNPTSNTFYLPRDGGSHFDAAWVSAQQERATSRHVWIDTWNETGEGSGMFAGDTLSYAATDKGPCSQFVNLHAESWGQDSRHYINETRAGASAWNDVPDLDAIPLASDAPTSLKPGERRYVTVVMQNSGDTTWQTPGPQLGLSAASAADDFHITASTSPQADELSQRFGGVARGLPGVFTLLVTAPCSPGKHTLSLEMIDPQTGRFGTAFSIDIDVEP